MKRLISLLGVIICFILKLNSQIAGVFNIPGSFPNVAAAINTLNITGVAGAVTINIAAGHTETVPVGGIKLINPPGSTTTSILFQKFGTGANPILYAYSGGTASPTSGTKDGIFTFVDCQNITIDGLDLVDNNTTSPANMEYGYGFYKLNSAGANRNNTIQNSTISLKGNLSGIVTGIEVTRALYTASNFIFNATTTLQTNSNNTFRGNLFLNCRQGIIINVPSNAGLPDNGNKIGGLSAVSGNTIFVTSAVSLLSADGIKANGQIQIDVNNNFLVSNGVPFAGIDISSVNSNISNNSFSMNVVPASCFAIRHISNGGSSNISNNVLSNSSFNATSLFTYSFVTVDADSVNMSNNQVNNVIAASGTISAFGCKANYTNIQNNSVTNLTVTTNGIVDAIRTFTVYEQTISNNLINNIEVTTMATPSPFSRISAISSIGSIVSANSNTITNLRGYLLYGMDLTSGSYLNATMVVSNNRINNLSGSLTSTVGTSGIGMSVSTPSNSISSAIVNDNVLHSFNSSFPNPNPMGGIGAYSGNLQFYRNKVYNLSNDNHLWGISPGGINANVYNNLVGQLNSNYPQNISAMITGGSNIKVSYNTIYFNVTSTTNTLGTTLMKVNGGNFQGLELKNNILVNASSAPGIHAITNASGTSSLSNNNCYYFGSNGRMVSGIPSTSLLANYKSLYNSDSQSFIENPPFLSLIGSNPNFLKIDPIIPTQIESGAIPITTITTDFYSTIRNFSPDIGAIEGNYMQADATSPSIIASGFTGPPCNNSNRTFTANITDLSGVATGTLAPRLYYRINFGLYTSTQGVLTSGTVNNGIWTFTLNYSANLGDVIWYFLVSQDVSYLNNVSITPAIGSSVVNVNNVAIPPNPALNYTLQTFPTISLSATSATICQGQQYTISPIGASIYSVFPGNLSVVSPSSNTNYTISGQSSLGCLSTNTLNLNISVNPSPTLSVNSGTICSGSNFTIIPTGGITYTYQSGSSIVNPGISTNYVVIGNNSLGCTSTATAFVTVNQLPNISVNNGTICAGTSFTIIPSGAITYTFEGNNPIVAPVVTTNYTIAGTDANGCIGSTNVVITVFDCTDIKEMGIEDINIYPNPSYGIVYLDLVKNNTFNYLRYKILDVSGREVIKEDIQISEHVVKINLSNLVDGFYFLELTNYDKLISRTKIFIKCN